MDTYNFYWRHFSFRSVFTEMCPKLYLGTK